MKTYVKIFQFIYLLKQVIKYRNKHKDSPNHTNQYVNCRSCLNFSPPSIRLEFNKEFSRQIKVKKEQ